jgi:hypothetical protein
VKVIFLDIDGVLVNEAYIKQHKADPYCVDALNTITNATGAKIVISSTWKHYGLAKITLILKQWGVSGEVIDITPDMPEHMYRWSEIGAWLANDFESRGELLESFVIIDDEKDACPSTSVCVITSFDNGLTMQGATRAIDILDKFPLTPHSPTAGGGWLKTS